MFGGDLASTLFRRQLPQAEGAGWPR